MGSAGTKKVYFEDLNKDIFLEVQNESIYCLWCPFMSQHLDLFTENPKMDPPPGLRDWSERLLIAMPAYMSSHGACHMASAMASEAYFVICLVGCVNMGGPGHLLLKYLTYFNVR